MKTNASLNASKSKILAMLVPVLMSFVAVSAAVGISVNTPLPTEAEPPAQPAPFEYLLREESRNLELYCLSFGAWEKVADFSLPLDDLPETDRQWLQAGIALRDAEELQRALEDYLPMG